MIISLWIRLTVISTKQNWKWYY